MLYPRILTENTIQQFITGQKGEVGGEEKLTSVLALLRNTRCSTESQHKGMTLVS